MGVYQSLKSSSSIRLFKLQPGLEGSPLIGELVDVDLTNAPDFEALSYVWGSEANKLKLWMQ